MDPFANLEPAEPGPPPPPPPPQAGPPPLKKRKTALPKQPKAPKQPKQPRQPRLLPAGLPPPLPSDDPLREDPTYRLLCAYGRSPLIAPKLKKAGLPVDSKALRRVPRELLPALLDEVEEALEGEVADGVANEAIRRGMKVLEEVIDARTKYKIAGTTDACFDNERWLFLLERAKLRAGIGLQRLDPLTEMALLTAQTAAMTHFMNSTSRPQTNLDAPAPEKI